MRLGISGAQSVGKTTLLNALRSEKVFADFKFCNEVTRRVQSYGLLINENGNDVTQRLIMQEHIVNVFMYNDMITDRTALDGVVYTRYLLDNGKVTQKAYDHALEVFKALQHRYDVQFYIKPEFEIENDGVRSVDRFFRDRVVTIFEETIEQHNIPVVYLTGSVRDRVQQIIDEYNKKEQEFQNETEYNCDY